MRWWILGILVVGGCKRELPIIDKPDPNLNDDPVDDTQGTVDSDTGLAPRCDVTETEPNNTVDLATVLPLEALGCGTFQELTDADAWRAEMPEQGWLGIEVDAYRVGSEANVALSVSSTLPDTQFGALGHMGLPDVTVRIPADVATFDLVILQQLGIDEDPGVGDEYFYEVRATSTKPPFLWDLDEGPNEGVDAPQVLPVVVGEALTVFGSADATGDQDWYAVEVPAGRHTVTFDVFSHEGGSVGDFALKRANEAGQVVETVTNGEIGWEPDPWMQVDAYEAQTIRVQVIEEGANSGRAFWYGLTVTVED